MSTEDTNSAFEADRRGPVGSLHQLMMTDIEARILSGDWPPGHRLPTEKELCEEYSCSRMTASKVLTQLAKAGLVERRKRAGSFVARPRSQSAVLEIHDIRSEVEELGEAYAYRLLRREITAASGLSHIWVELPTDGCVLVLAALHLAGERPFCFEERALNLDAVPDAENVDFATVSPTRWLLEHIPWTTAEHEISAEGATGEIAEVLDIPIGRSCLVMHRRTWNTRGPVTSVRLTYPGDRHTLKARFNPNS